MPALFGYLVAISILLGGSYAGLHWLSAPEAVPGKKTAAHSGSAPDISRSGLMSVPNAVDPRARAENHGKAASVERSDESGQEAKHTGPFTTDRTSKSQKGAPAGGCAPIGLTANGDLVFSMQCQEMIERHRSESASSEAVSTAPAPVENQAARLTNPNKGNEDGSKDRTMDVAAQPPDRAAHRGRGDRVGTVEIRPGDPDAEYRVSQSANSRAGFLKDARAGTLNRSGNSKPDREAATLPKLAKQKQIPQTRSDTISRTAERRHDMEQRLPRTSRRMAARGDSDLWYNVLGLR
jgi:hypothetical protein